jgi:hypothetical protein
MAAKAAIRYSAARLHPVTTATLPVRSNRDFMLTISDFGFSIQA